MKEVWLCGTNGVQFRKAGDRGDTRVLDLRKPAGTDHFKYRRSVGNRTSADLSKVCERRQR